MIHITYTNKNYLTAKVPYDRLSRLVSISLEHIALTAFTFVARNLETNTYTIYIKVPHNDLQPLIKLYQQHTKSITVKKL